MSRSQQRADEPQLHELISQADIVLDCSDNFDTRYAVNRACLALRKPLVSGAAIQFHGQVAVFDFRSNDTPCYNCLFPEDSVAEEMRCATTGVFSPTGRHYRHVAGCGNAQTSHGNRAWV